MRQADVVKRLVEFWSRNDHVFSWEDAQRLSVDSRTMKDLIDRGLVVRLHKGVYAVAAVARDPLVVSRAALRAAERRLAGAKWQPRRIVAASHATAAWVQGIVERPPSVVHIMVGIPHPLHLAGVVVHRCDTEVLKSRSVRGLRCTDPTLTLVDLAASVGPGELADALDRALSKRLVRVRDLTEATLGPGFAGRRGVGRLRRCLEARGDLGMPSPSVLESRMTRLMHAHNLPPARAECVAGPNGEYRLDYAYEVRRVAVEVFGYTWHHSPEQMAYDLARQRQLVLGGWTVLIFTWQDVTDDPERVAAELRQALFGPVPAAASH